jgi:hypothetical protein
VILHDDHGDNPMNNGSRSCSMTDKPGKITPETVISGAAFRDFYENHWPGKNWYIADVLFEFDNEDGKFTLPADARVKLKHCGYLVWQGPEGKPYHHGEMFPFIDFYREFAEKRTTAIVVAEVPLDRMEEALAYLASIGVEIKSDDRDAPCDDAEATATPKP